MANFVIQIEPELLNGFTLEHRFAKTQDIITLTQG